MNERKKPADLVKGGLAENLADFSTAYGIYDE